MTDKLAAAKSLAARGFRVFPLIENGKLPAIQGWPDKATTDAEQISKWWGPDPVTGWETDYNIGVLTGRGAAKGIDGLVVLDIDDKGTKHGSESLKALESIHDDFPTTYTVRTASGGRHLYLHIPGDKHIRLSRSELADGLDTQGDRGFVVGPGSTIGGVEYRVTHDAPIALCPVFLRDFCNRDSGASGRLRGQLAGAITPGVELDTADAVARATAYLLTAEPAVEGAGGNHHTFKVAARVKDFGVSQSRALDLMLDHWNDTCAPSWQPDDLADIVANAYEYGDRPVGVSSPAADFEFTASDSTGGHSGKLFFELPGQITAENNAKYLIENYLTEAAVSVVYGETNTGKTFVVLDMAYHIARGLPWLGNKTRQGAVVYVSAEGGGGIRKRVVALKKHFGTDDFAFALVPCPLTLNGKKEADELVALVEKVAIELKQPVALVVIDTVAQALSGDENSFEDMNRFIHLLYRIRNATGAHVTGVHHTGKDAARGARGHSALKAATDSELEVSKGILKVTKQRDMEYADVRRFSLRVVDVGSNGGGKVTSCVVDWSAPATDFDETPLTPEEEGCLDAVKAATEEGAEASTLEVLKAYEVLGKPPVPKRTILKWLIALETKAAVKRCGGTKDTRWKLS